MNRGHWYFNRLAAMSAPEILHRMVEQGKRSVSRFVTPDLSRSVKENAELPEFPYLKDGVAQLQSDDELTNRWQRIAARVSEGRYCALGIEWPQTNKESRWHMDPITGTMWPQEEYCFRIPFRHAVDSGDVKYVWELNRLQYLQPVAALASLDNDSKLAALCVRELESWIDANPPFRGVNWASGIELACRVVSILTVCSLLEKAVFSRSQTQKFLGCLAIHGYWLMRYPSRFSSANNHLIAEAGALFLLGSLADGLNHAKQWEQYGRATLEREVIKQIYDDGVGAEQSPTYTAFTLEWLLLCGETARRMARPFSERFWNRIARAGEFLACIIDSKGNYPAFGDDDEGRVVYSHPEGKNYVSNVLSCLSTATNGCVEVLGAPEGHLRQALFGRSVSTAAKHSRIHCFRTGGYTVVRSEVPDARYLLLFDHGPLGYLSIAAHGHADALAIWLHVDDRPVLVDAGTYLYHAGGRWRDYARGTAAHNTLVLQGTDSSKMAGPFNWSRRAHCTLVEFAGDPQCWSVEAEHDGYAKEFGVRHRRRLERVSDKAIAVADTLVGENAVNDAFDVEIGFLVHPTLSVHPIVGGWKVSDRDRDLVLIEHPAAMLQSEMQCGQHQPPRGWYSAVFGKKTATTRLAFRGRLNIEATFRFFIKLL